jgi:ribosomal protein S18 acetylase RimI-like enzyme
MRTEAAYQRLGLARCLLTTGLNRLAAGGSQRFKVSYEAGNPAARDLYLGAGFKPESTAQVFRRGLA